MQLCSLKLPFVIRYVPDKCKTKKMCDKAILKNDRIPKSVPNQYKTQEMCDNYMWTIMLMY